jgi:hypothetical protein
MDNWSGLIEGVGGLSENTKKYFSKKDLISILRDKSRWNNVLIEKWIKSI